MTTEDFKAFVRTNEVWFRGRLPESTESIRAAEEALCRSLPASIAWILVEYGYRHGTAISHLQESVSDTLLARTHHSLPGDFIILNTLQDAGLILINVQEETSPGEAALYWVGLEDIGPTVRLEGHQRFSSYGDYVADRLPEEQEFIPPDMVAYDPSKDEHASQARREPID